MQQTTTDSDKSDMLHGQTGYDGGCIYLYGPNKWTALISWGQKNATENETSESYDWYLKSDERVGIKCERSWAKASCSTRQAEEDGLVASLLGHACVGRVHHLLQPCQCLAQISEELRFKRLPEVVVL